VADDASPLKDATQGNEDINDMPNCQYIIKPTNTGSAATRNFLAAKSRYPWLLFIDCDVEISNPSFLYTYLLYIDKDYDVINGGIAVADNPLMNSNLRYIYEKRAEADHTAARRQKQRYQEFRSTNFIIRRDVFLQHPFDERFTKSGYEDVLFGKHLKLNGISILHIDNPVTMTEFETNPDYVAKTERNLRTLYQFRSDLRGYSRLLTLVSGIHIPAILWLMRLWHRMFGAIERRNLCGSRPYLLVFKLYRLGYYLKLTR
jgi:glycosyltransferase involved in cell wall biosynthesis